MGRGAVVARVRELMSGSFGLGPEYKRRKRYKKSMNVPCAHLFKEERGKMNLSLRHSGTF